MGRPHGNTVDIRQQAIVDLVNQLGEVNFAQLRSSFPTISDVTLRKDLKYLDAANQLIRIHGGAKSLPQVLNHHFRSSLHQEEKQLIATKAAQLIRPNDSLFITSGTSCIALAAKVPVMPLHIFSDGISTVPQLPRAPEVQVEILGGEVNLNLMRVEGAAVVDALSTLHFNTAFLGTPGLHPEHGFAIFSSNISAVMSKVIERSDQVVILMDSSKVNYSYTARMIPLEDVDIVVSDDRLDPSVKSALESKGVLVL